MALDFGDPRSTRASRASRRSEILKVRPIKGVANKMSRVMRLPRQEKCLALQIAACVKDVGISLVDRPVAKPVARNRWGYRAAEVQITHSSSD